MANNYLQTSAFLPIPKDKIELAKTIVADAIEELEVSVHNDYEACYCDITVEGDGIWFRDDGERFVPDHLEYVASDVINKLELPDPFIFSWAYTCSKPRIDEFGGGACAIQLGKGTVWVDAYRMAETLIEKA